MKLHPHCYYYEYPVCMQVMAADHQENVITDRDVAELKVLCPLENRAPKQDQAVTVEEHSGEPSTELLEGPAEERSGISSKEHLQNALEEPSEVPEHQLQADPAPGVTSNRTERLDEEHLERAAPQDDIHFSAKENKEEGSQRSQEKQEEEEDKQEKEGKYVKEKEVQKEAQPMENLLPAIPTTRDDVQYENQTTALKEYPDETPAEGFGSQKSRLDLQSQDYHPPLELLGEELLTSFVVVDSNSQDQISGAKEFPDGSPTSDHMKAPSPASPASPLEEYHNFTALQPETVTSCESEDQISWTREPPESTPDHLVLVSDIPKTSSEAFDQRLEMAGIGGMKKVEEEQEKEELKVKAVPAEGEPEAHYQEEELLLDSTHKEMELHPDSTQEEELHPDSTQAEELHPDSAEEEGLHPNFVQEKDLLHNSRQKEELPPQSAPEKVELIVVCAQEKEELLFDSIQTVELLPTSTQEDVLPPNFIQKEQELLHDFAKEEEENELPPNSAQEEEASPNFIKNEVKMLSNSTVEVELLSEPAQKVQLPIDSIQKEVLLPDPNQGEKLPPVSAQEEELCHDAAQEEKFLLNSTKKEVKLFCSSTQGEKLLSEFAQEEELPHDSTQKVAELLPDSAFSQEVQLHSNLIQKKELLPDSNQEEKLPPNSAQEEELIHDVAQEKKLPLNSTVKVQLLPNSTKEEESSSGFAQEEELRHDPSLKIEQLCDSTQEEELSPDSTQDDITPPVTTVSWWSSGGRDPAPGDWILIPEFLAAANEDTFGNQVENEYQRLMDQFAAQVEASLKVAVEAIEREGGEEEMEEKSRGAEGQEEQKVEKNDEGEKKGDGEEQMEKKKKAGEEEVEQERRTEISIMEATMDVNEWVTDSGQQPLPWLGISTQELAEESSASCAAGGLAPRVAAIPPLMPQTVEVTFRLHYLTWSEQQTLAITGSRPELGGWAAFIPLEREAEGKEEGGESEGRGLWSGRVRLPAHSQLEWKFVVLEMGRVSRWEECRNRVLDTGDRDQLVHGWWGRE